MRKLKLSKMASAEDNLALYHALGKGSVWIEVDDFYHPLHGTIGELSSDEFAYALSNGNTSYDINRSVLDGYHSRALIRFLTQNNKLFTGNKKQHTIRPDLVGTNWLIDYNGPHSYVMDKKFTQRPFVEYDLFGNEIKKDTLVVAGDSTGISIGTINRLYAERRYDILVRAKINVIHTNSRGVNTRGTAEISVPVNNIVVITDHLKAQAMIAKLTK